MDTDVQFALDESSGTTGASNTMAPACFHCGLPVNDRRWRHEEKLFCCQGCRTVYELLTENGLEGFYDFAPGSGVRAPDDGGEEQFRFLDEAAVRERLVDYSDERFTRVTFRLPAIHCIACVWLLENLCRLKVGLGAAQVNFLRRELTLSFQTAVIKLSEVVALLTRLGYPPELNLSDLDGRPCRTDRRLWLQLGVAGFAFGNIMLFSIPTYLGLERWSAFHRIFGYLSFALSIPVIVYSASDYWRNAWTSLRHRMLNIEVPIALGLAAFFGQSTYELWLGHGDSYFDSLSGLVFFLLCGKWFQQKSYDRLAFDRDFKSFFPLAVTRCKNGSDEAGETQRRKEERVALAHVQVGDRLLVRHGELIPADSRLVSGNGLIDYSFVTGESEPVERRSGDHLYAGGRQSGGSIEVETIKAVSQSYLTSLWNQAAFRKEKASSLQSLTNRVSRWFTVAVLGIAIGAALFWLGQDPGRSVRAFTAVLIVACPCASALAAPFALGTAQRALARARIFLKNPQVVETLARTDYFVFDKTGTLTIPGGELRFDGTALSRDEQSWISSIARHSVHPLAARLNGAADLPVQSFREYSGQGLEGVVAGRLVLLGSRPWFDKRGVAVPTGSEGGGSEVLVAVNGEYRGCFLVGQKIRSGVEKLLAQLGERMGLALLSGDQHRGQLLFQSLFDRKGEVRFQQSPLEKLQFIQARQAQGHRVCMVGDGLNDAGALRQSDAGIAVVEEMGMFSPASDVILPAAQVTQLGGILCLARKGVAMVKASLLISAGYNAIGIYFAARGLLSPIICAILMPISSVTVVAFASLGTRWLAKRILDGSEREQLPASSTKQSCLGNWLARWGGDAVKTIFLLGQENQLPRYMGKGEER